RTRARRRSPGSGSRTRWTSGRSRGSWRASEQDPPYRVAGRERQPDEKREQGESEEEHADTSTGARHRMQVSGLPGQIGKEIQRARDEHRAAERAGVVERRGRVVDLRDRRERRPAPRGDVRGGKGSVVRRARCDERVAGASEALEDAARILVLED